MSRANELLPFVVLDAGPDLLEEERDARLIVAHDEREARAIYVHVCTVGDEGAPKAIRAKWGWPAMPMPPLPSEAGEWWPDGWRGFGIYGLDDPACDGCGEYVDPDDFDVETECCPACLAERAP